MAINSDATWKKLGSDNPYWGVLTNEKFEKSRITDEDKLVFFESGEKYVQEIEKDITSFFGAKGLQGESVLDFGCGVGRLLIPLAKRYSKSYGCDISASVLNECEKNLQQSGIDNFELFNASSGLNKLPTGISFIHSFIVFQHIPQKRGMEIFKELIQHLADGGIGALHLVYHRGISDNLKARLFLYRNFPFLFALRNLFKKGKSNNAFLEMNSYDINSALKVLQEGLCHEVAMRFTLHEEYQGCIIYFRKTTKELL